MQKGPDVRRIKQEKRGKAIEPAAVGMTRRRFLTFLGAGSAALTAGSTGVLAGCAQGQDEGAAAGGAQDGGQGQGGDAGAGAEAFFEPIEPSDADDLILPEGYKYDLVLSSGDSLGGGMVYGDHNDFVSYFPIDVLEGGDNSG
ncbi:MAG: PhoX family protein, partial [Actinomycetota bacterium]|nr:PhoX family protein [Actinomycetota bacterium]